MPLTRMVDTLYLYDSQFRSGSSAAIDDIGGSSEAFGIDRRSDLQDALSNFVGVRTIIFDTHGAPGLIGLPDGTRLDGMDLGIMARGRNLLKPDARVLFLGCNVGEGAAGDKFLDDIGQYFLSGRGGYVGAATVATSLFQLGPISTQTYMNPFGGRLKVARYDGNGKSIGSRSVNQFGTPD